jgi:hypothetical protein
LEKLVTCPSCKNKISLSNPVSFREMCPNCDHEIHTCVSCRFYSPGKPSDCQIPGIETVKEKEKNNFCEDFKFDITQKTQASKVSKQESIKNFNSLFKD